MGLDLAKYRAIFVEDSTEHLAGFSRALLALEKQPTDAEEIDTIFRMAHSIKGMAASLGYESVAEIAHQLEGRMQTHRNAGCLGGAEEISLLFRGLEALEEMIGVVRETEEAPPPRPELVAVLGAPVAPPDEAAPASKLPGSHESEAKKKLLIPIP